MLWSAETNGKAARWYASLALWISVALGTASARPAAAQPSPRRPLSLATAFALAERQNLDLAAARRQREVAQAEVGVAAERPNPIANFDALRDEPHEGLFFSQDLELGGKRQRRIELAQADAQLTETRIGNTAAAVRRQVREAYFALLLAREKTELSQRLLDLAQQLARIARDRYQAGDVAQLEVLQAELEVARATVALQVAQQQEQIARSRLNAVLNAPPDADWELTDSLDRLPAIAPLAALQQQALRNNPDLLELISQRQVDRSRLALARAEQIPNLTLEFGTDFNSPHDFRVGPRSHLGIELPLFHHRQAEVAAALASQHQTEDQLAAATRRVQAEVEQAYQEFQARMAEVTSYREKLLPATRQLEQMSEESYRAGKTGILTVLDAQRSVQELESNYLDSLYAAQVALAALEQVVGTPIRPTETP